MIHLLDANVLIALFLMDHIHHRRANAWFNKQTSHFATCSVTQGSLLRLHMRLALDDSAGAAWASLKELTQHPRHTFWNDGTAYTELSHDYVQGHRQITDFWLIDLARRQKGQVATFDKGLCTIHPEHSYLIPDIA